MKKVVVFFIVAMIVFGACSAQRAEAQSANNAQRIIGTWVEQDGRTWVFNTNGTLTIGSKNFKYGATDTKLATSPSLDGYDIFDISISSDGKTLIITFTDRGSIKGVWLTKK
jgi:hypothetical protein